MKGRLETGIEGLDIAAASAAERPLLENLYQLYMHDFSELFADTLRLDLGADGRYIVDPPVDRWWQAPAHVPLLLRWHGRPAGFALINNVSHLGTPVDRAVGEFFVVRKHRRRGLGVAAARAVFAQWPGEWEAAVMRANTGGRAFWERAIGGCSEAAAIVAHDRDDAMWNGTVFRFRIAT